MGDRGNIVVQHGDERVFLYTHWRGSECPQILQDALRRGGSRWDDAPYLARIVLDSMTRGDNEGTSGFGVWPTLGDNEYPILIADVATQSVFLADEGPGGALEVRSGSVPFDAYCQLSLRAADDSSLFDIVASALGKKKSGAE